MIEVYSPFGIWHIFLYSIITDKNEIVFVIAADRLPVDEYYSRPGSSINIRRPHQEETTGKRSCCGGHQS